MPLRFDMEAPQHAEDPDPQSTHDRHWRGLGCILSATGDHHRPADPVGWPMIGCPVGKALAADRSTLVDFIHNTIADCDAAAQRLARSSRDGDKRLAAEWQKLRATECVRLPEPAGSATAD